MADNTAGFSERWNGKGNEKSDTQKFWLELLRDVLGIEYPEQHIDFEKHVALEHTSYIDAYIPSTGTVIEQKSCDVSLDKAITQSDGTEATPYQQAKRYYDWLPASQRGRFIVACNFREFRIYDMEQPKAQPEIITLSSLARERHKLAFLTDTSSPAPKEIREVTLSVKAGELVAKLYDSLLERYINPDDKDSQKSLNVFCVRIVFLLYAEDAGLFAKSQFHDYIKDRQNMARDVLRKLFEVLSTHPEERDPYLDDELKAFKYVNGGLFAESDIEIPRLDGEPLRIIIEEMSEGFDWSGISPTIFGAVFESTLNPETRHTGGMHYTSVENIHKVIDPLFMDELNAEFDAALSSPAKARTQKLRAFQRKIASLKFFDPACGSGNFLTEAYLSLRRLENRILAELSKQISFTDTEEDTPIQVSISQFYGIEINDFAVSVARTALWIAEAQMWNETKNIIKFYGDLLPLKTYGNIREANALRTDWAEIIPPGQLSYIMGNPPFYGHQWRKREQAEDMSIAFRDMKDPGKLDYVCAWYNKAADFIRDTDIRAAFVSTNSISQGESVSVFWKFILRKINLFLAYRPFVWQSEAEDKAHVHCIITGFTHQDTYPKYIYDSAGIRREAKHINGYLLDAPDFYITNRTKQMNADLPGMKKGSQPTDGGNLIMSPSERDEIISRYPEAERFIRRYMGGRDFLYDLVRYCIWLAGAEPGEYRHIKPFMQRLALVAECRRKSSTKSVRQAADTPMLFTQIRQPESGNFMVVPEVTSHERQYIPMGYMSSDIIASNKIQIIPDANPYIFGVLMSRIHMAWVDIVAGRLGMSYSYSPAVYHNFPFPACDDDVRGHIESTAGRILEVRGKFRKSTLADMYDPLSMPPELRAAHRENDAAVCRAYGWPEDIGDMDIAAGLFGLYERMK